MAESTVQKDFKLTKAEKEKELQAQAAQELYYSYPLPDNISEMKSFAFGQFTWRDVMFMGGAEIVGVMLMLPFQAVLPMWLCIVIGVVIGLPFAFLSIKHVFTGDLPIEERVKIALAEKGKSNLLYWDKTKEQNGDYVLSSTQSFVPDLEFTADDMILLPGEKGGFTVIELSVDDVSQAKNTDMLGIVNSFKRLLDSLIQDTDCTPIQIMLKSIPKNLKSYIAAAEQRAEEIEERQKYCAAARAEDYADQLRELDEDKAFYYKYYIVVTYREDTEHVGEDTMNTASVRRQKLKEKGLNPLNKRAKAAKNADFKVGMTEEERKQAMRQTNRESEFGRRRTRDALERRVGMIANMIRDLGSTHTAVQPRILSEQEIAKLIFDCYNSEDKNVVDAVLTGALLDKDTIYSANMYREYPELFALPKKPRENKTLSAQKRGAYTTREGM